MKTKEYTEVSGFSGFVVWMVVAFLVLVYFHQPKMQTAATAIKNSPPTFVTAKAKSAPTGATMPLALKNLVEKKPPFAFKGTILHTVRSRETLNTIARAYHIRYQWVVAANPDKAMRRDKIIFPGEKIKIWSVKWADQVGIASWYGRRDGFHGKKMSNGEIFDTDDPSVAAHQSFPPDALLKVTNLKNGFVHYVRVKDGGPFFEDRVLDLSEAAAKKLGYYKPGTARVRIKLVSLS